MTAAIYARKSADHAGVTYALNWSQFVRTMLTG
jgi:hypothetical protein